MLFTLQELVDLVVMTLAIGYIFSTFVRREPTEGYDPITYYKKNTLFEDIKFGAMIAAPAIVLHELMHKFAAMAFGAVAVLHAPDLMGIPYGWYILVIVMRLLNFPLLFFIGGYVAHSALPPLQSAFVAAAGPLTNLVLFLVFSALVKYRIVNKKFYKTLGIMAKLNLFLFGFNLIPLPGFDGFSLFAGLLKFLGIF